MIPTGTLENEAVLLEWRPRIIIRFVAVVAVMSTAMMVVAVVDARTLPDQWPTVIVYGILTLLLIALALFRGIGFRIKACGV